MARVLLVSLAVTLSAGALFPADFIVNVGPGLTFSPGSVTVQQGDTVIWNFLEGNHSTTSDAVAGVDSWDSGVLAAGTTFEHTFFTAGNHPYYCKVHSSAGGFTMNGTVIVDADLTPFISGFTPTTGPISGGTEVTVTGSNFAGDCQVAFGGFAATTIFVDAGTLQAITPAVSEEGSVDVTVSCATGSDSAAEFGTFDYVAAPAAIPIPAVSNPALLGLAAALAAIGAFLSGRNG